MGCPEFGSSWDLHEPSFIEDPYPTYARLRESCPVLHSDRYMGGFWVLSRHDDVRNAVGDWEAFTSTVPGVTAIPMIIQRTEPLIPIELDPPLHTRYRQLVGHVFRRQRVEELRPGLMELATGLVDGIVQRGRGDLAREFAIELSTGTLGRFLDLPDEDGPRWVGWIKRLHGSVRDMDDARAATAEIRGYVEGLVAERRERPRDDFISFLLTSEVEGERLSDTSIRDFVHLTINAGFETTAGAMGLSLLELAKRPELRRRLFGTPELIPSAVEELLRFTSPVQIFARNAARDVELHGRRIPAGDIVTVAFASANRDPSAFADPDEIVLDRSPNKHLSFGFGPHVCLGAWVARLELQVMLAVFAERMPEFHLEPGGPIVRKGRGDQIALESLPVIVGPDPGEAAATTSP
jgi:cytochrome P450